MNLVSIRPVSSEFHEGDSVVLLAGPYQGTAGSFRRFREDVKWADLAELNGDIREHPVEWMAHAQPVQGTN